MSEQSYAKIVRVEDSYLEFIINKGRNDGVTEQSVFVIYEIGDEIIDPETNKNLGKLEIIKGKVKAKHIQDNMTTIISDEYEKEPNIQRMSMNNQSIWSGIPQNETVVGRSKIKPIFNVEVGDLVKKIR